MANLEDLKDVVDKQLKEICVSDELKQKTLMKCKETERNKKNKGITWFRLPKSIKKPMVALTCGLVILLALANYPTFIGSKNYDEAYPQPSTEGSEHYKGSGSEQYKSSDDIEDFITDEPAHPANDGQNQDQADDAEETTESTEEHTDEDETGNE